MYIEDDSDIKIFGSKEKDNSENETLVEIEKQHENGNIALAKKLGAMLSDELLPENSISQFGFVDGRDVPLESEELRFQRRVLMAFCVEVGLDIYIPNTIVSSTAVDEFHSRIETEHPDFYKKVMNMGAFSFYYLGLRTEGRAEKAIGAVFAKLCREENKKLYADFGEALFIYFMDTIESAVRELGFSDLEEEKDTRTAAVGG